MSDRPNLPPAYPEMKPRAAGEGQAPISLDALVFALLCAAYLPMRFIIPTPPIIPGSTPATIALIAAIMSYFALDLIGARTDRARRRVLLGKWLLVVIAIGVIALAPMVMNILVRQQSAPHLHAHDGMIQTETAAQFVLAGKNPYVETFAQTPMALAPFDVKGVAVNPALEHFAYLPLTFLLPLPAQAALGSSFDLRYAHLLFFIATLLVAAQLTQHPQRRLLLVMALGLNPLLVGPLIEGRNDVMVLSWLIFTWALLQRGRMTASAITLALACGTKHPALVFVPFYFVYLISVQEPAGRAPTPGKFAAGEPLLPGLSDKNYLSAPGSWRERVKRVQKPFWVWAGLTALIIAPWFLLNPSAFIDDTVSYLNGTSAASYPISGFSFGMLLVSLGLLPSNTVPFPFGLLQIAIGLPVAAWLLWRQWRDPNLPTAIAGFAILLFIAQFFSRIFNDNYLGLIIAIISVAALMDAEIRRPDAAAQASHLP